jgi:hypothetical protein
MDRVNSRVIVVGLVVLALVAIGVGVHSAESQHTSRPKPTAATSPDWAENVLADTSEQQTDLDNLDADAGLPDIHSLTQDCASTRDSLGSWTSDEAAIVDGSMRTSFTNAVVQLGEAVDACKTNDLKSISDHVTAAGKYVDATVAVIQVNGWGD